MTHQRSRWVILTALGMLAACFAVRGSHGGGQVKVDQRRELQPADIALPSEYRAEVVASGLTFPVGITFDDHGGIYVLESGYSYGEVFTTPRILKLDGGGRPSVVASGENPPWNGIVFDDGQFFVAEGGQKTPGRILRIGRDGRIVAIAEGLPSLGDHHTNGPAIGPDGWIYFGQGTATNSGVVGDDSAKFGWLARHPDFHDTPCKDITVSGNNYESQGGKTLTGPFSPHGTQVTPGQRIPGKLPCNGSVMRVRRDGGPLELVAWGFRNPFGLAFAPDGRLFVTDNGYDERGSRPIYGAADALWEVKRGAWHGWPDYADGRPVAQGDRYASVGKPKLKPVMAQEPNQAPKPSAFLAVHSSSTGLDFSRSERFGHVGEAFIAQFGDMAPTTGKVLAPVGFKVVRVDVSTGIIEEFASNRAAKKNGPASMLKTGGLERPVAARFDPSGEALYIVDFGVMTVTKDGPEPRRETGVVWKVTRSGG
jgi:glucose/arabinose dehydrogenase